MYQDIDNTIAITVNDWLKAGLTENQLWKDSRCGLLKILRRGINGETTIDVKSIKRRERMAVIEAAYGKVNAHDGKKSLYSVEIDTRARAFYSAYTKPDGTGLMPDKISEYTSRASIFNALRDGMRKQIEARARNNKRLKMGDFWREKLVWHTDMAIEYGVPVFSNERSLERAFKEYLKGGYAAIIHKAIGNDSARKVSTSAENLLLALWRTNDKPFVDRVHELYIEFVAGSNELFDRETGELYRPEDFRYKGKALEISRATVWNYLKEVVNNTAVYSDRNGNFDYANSRRPKQHRKPGQYSLSKISMDDVALSRKSIRGWVYKYMAVDVVSGYWFRPAYVVGKPTHATVYESFRNMFCELLELGLPMPGELEVEHHLMKDLDWLNKAFAFTRFCQSPTEKRAEHSIKALKYGAAKSEGHTRGRWYAKHEAYRSVRNKVDGDFIEPEYQPQTVVADDLADIVKHNNELHPLQRTYPKMTRRDVFLKNYNPNLKPIEKQLLYRYIGNETETSIYNNDYCPVANEEFELTDFDALKRMKPNSKQIMAYWLPEESGSINKVYLWQGDTYIGEALNRRLFDYNECAIERTDEDKEAMLHQNKRLSKFDKTIRERRAEIPKVGRVKAETSAAIVSAKVDIVETEQPMGYDEDECLTTDYAALAKQQL